MLGNESLIEGWRAAWKPRDPTPAPEWCCRNLRLPPKVTKGGPFDLEEHPYWREVLEASEDPATEDITIVAATQTGKTVTLSAILGFLAVMRPAPAMICAPDRDAMRERRDEFYLMAEESPGLAPHIPPPHRRNDQWIDFGECVVHLAWSGNYQRISGKSCRVVLVTEHARCRRAVREGAFDRTISERTKAWHNFLKVFEGTPTDDECPHWARYDEQSDRRQWHVPCPHCSHWQPLRFFLHRDGDYAGKGGVDGLRDEEGKWLTPEEAMEKAYYVCEKGCRIEEHDRRPMVLRGQWVPAGQTVGKDGKLKGKPKRGPRHRGYHLSSQVAENIPFGRMAAEYLSCRDDDEQLRAFFNNWLGLKFSLRRKLPKTHQLHARLRGSHPRGTCPPGALILTAGGDIHERHGRWVVRAWGEGRTSWLVDWGIVEPDNPTPAKILGAIYAATMGVDWPLVTANVLGHTKLSVRRLGQDMRPDTHASQAWGRKYYHDQSVFLVQGQDTIAGGVAYTPGNLERNTHTGRVYPGGLKFFNINKDHYLTDRHSRFDMLPSDPGMWWLCDAPFDECEQYLRELLAEAPKDDRDKAGHYKKTWVVVDKSAGEHYSDCEAYLAAMADMLVEGDWDNLAERLQAAEKKPAADRERQGGFVRKRSRPIGRRRG